MANCLVVGRFTGRIYFHGTRAACMRYMLESGRRTSTMLYTGGDYVPDTA